MSGKTITSKSPEETWEIAASVLKEISEAGVIALHGDLGAGKTCFAQGLAVALEVKVAITSPTFTIVNEYTDGTKPFFHIDLYRLNDPDEVLALGFEEYLEAEGIKAVEWAERAGDLMPENTIHIHFKTTDNPDERIITIEN